MHAAAAADDDDDGGDGGDDDNDGGDDDNDDGDDDDDVGVDDDDPAWMDVLIDVLMSLLSRDDNSVPRVIVNLSFIQLIPHFTQPSSLQLITQVSSFHMVRS